MIIVFGSVGMDMSLRLEKLPVAGETVLSTDYELYPGGRGANQALAAARAGARVALVGKVGIDDYGRKATEGLKSSGVMVSGVARSDMHPTGCSITVRDGAGNKQNIVMSGANMEATNDQVPDEILIKQNMLLMQMELPVPETARLLERAKAHGATTVLNLAPAIMVPRRALGLIDYLIVNSIEARQIGERLHMETQSNTLRIAQALAIEGQMTVVLTLGKQGSIAVTKDQAAWGVGILELDQAQILDTAGAGDAFCGTFAASIHAGHSLSGAMRRASVAGTLACLKRGAQPSLPFLDDIESRLSSLPDAVSLAL